MNVTTNHSISDAGYRMMDHQFNFLRKAIDGNIAYLAKAAATDRAWIDGESKETLTALYVDLADVLRDMDKAVKALPKNDWEYERVED